MIFAAPPSRANMGSLETTNTIVAAATVKNNFRDFFMTSPNRAEGGGSRTETSRTVSR
jgi:hypothetical protein